MLHHTVHFFLSILRVLLQCETGTRCWHTFEFPQKFQELSTGIWLPHQDLFFCCGCLQSPNNSFLLILILFRMTFQKAPKHQQVHSEPVRNLSISYKLSRSPRILIHLMGASLQGFTCSFWETSQAVIEHLCNYLPPCSNYRSFRLLQITYFPRRVRMCEWYYFVISILEKRLPLSLSAVVKWSKACSK